MSARSESGFTLVEALVSLFVFSIIAAGCVAVLMQSVESQKRASAAQAALAELQSARSLLSGDLLQITPRQVRRADDGRSASFAGGAGGMGFVRVLAEPDAAQGAAVSLTYVEYVVQEGQLVRRSRAALDPAAETDGAIERVVFESIEDARFEFFDGAQWREAWAARGSAGMPRAVAFEAVLPRYGRVRIETLTGLSP